MGSGCGSVGRAVASYTRDIQFKFSHQQNFIMSGMFAVRCWKDKNKEKRGWEWPIKPF